MVPLPRFIQLGDVIHRTSVRFSEMACPSVSPRSADSASGIRQQAVQIGLVPSEDVWEVHGDRPALPQMERMNQEPVTDRHG